LFFVMSGKYLLGNMLSAFYNKNCFYNNPVKVVYSGLCRDVLKIMEENGYVNSYKIIDIDGKKSINVLLQIINGNKSINSFKLISKPGRRVYASVKDLKRKLSYNPYSLLLVSTSKGVMKISDAIDNNVGGEILCEIF